MGGMTSVWYFHRLTLILFILKHDLFLKPIYRHKTTELFQHRETGEILLKRAFTTSFGSICYGSIIFSIVRMLRFIINVIKKVCQS
jgi:hypothetical protein